MNKTDATLASEMRRELLAQYGPLLGGSALHQALGFSSAASMRQAALRNQVGVRLFSITNRRGKFALTSDVAQWLADCAEAALDATARDQAPQHVQPTASMRSASARAADMNLPVHEQKGANHLRT